MWGVVLDNLDVIIHRYTESDEEQVKQLIDVCQEQAYLLRILKSKRLKFGFTARIATKVVGLVMGWKSDFHPHCTYIRILTNPFYNGWNIEEKLFSKMGKQALPLQTSIWETANNLKQFYESNGFQEIRRTYMPILNVNEVINHVEIVGDRSIKTLNEVLLNPTLKMILVQFVRKTYEETHLDNPVVEKTVEEWEELMLADVLGDGSFIYLDACEQNIKAYSFLHTSDEPNTFELGWCGSVGFDFLKCLLIKQIHYAKTSNIPFLQGEFDTTSPDAMFSLGILPFAPCPTWITYQYKNVGGII